MSICEKCQHFTSSLQDDRKSNFEEQKHKRVMFAEQRAVHEEHRSTKEPGVVKNVGVRSEDVKTVHGVEEVECKESQSSMDLVNFQSQMRYIQANKLKKRIDSMGQERNNKTVSRRLSPKSFLFLKSEIETGERIQRHFSRISPSPVLHFDNLAQEEQLGRLKTDYAESSYVLMSDSEAIIQTIEANNMFRKRELVLNKGWDDSLDISEDDSEEKLGCLESILIKIGLRNWLKFFF